MASEDELWEQMLKTEVSVDSVLKRIDREEKELQSLKDEKDNAETKEKILAIEESIDEDKKWISMQKKSQPDVVITQPPPKIDDIVANDTEIIRICSEISTFLINNANNQYITEFAQAINRASAQPTLANNNFLYQNKLTSTLSKRWEFIDSVKWYVRDIIKPKGLSISANLKTAIEAMEFSLRWFNLTAPAEERRQRRWKASDNDSDADVLSAIESMGKKLNITLSSERKRSMVERAERRTNWTPLFSSAEILSSHEDSDDIGKATRVLPLAFMPGHIPMPAAERRGPYYRNLKQVNGISFRLPGVPFFQEIYDNVLLKPGDGMIDRNIAIQYVSLVLQLHRRIQAIMIENGFQQGGKIKRTIKRRKTKKAKKSKKMIMYRKK